MSLTYRDLRVWQKLMKLVVAVYLATQRLLKIETYGLIGQMRRAAVSIPSNIAEGKGRLTDRDRSHFFSQARGSLLELETQILISGELKYLSSEDCRGLMELSAKTGRMLNALIQSIRPNPARSAA